MTYKLEPFIEKIASPLVCVFDDKEVEYTDGASLARETFDKYWLVDSLSVKDDKIMLVMRENTRLNNIEWIGEEAVDKGFF